MPRPDHDTPSGQSVRPLWGSELQPTVTCWRLPVLVAPEVLAQRLLESGDDGQRPP